MSHITSQKQPQYHVFKWATIPLKNSHNTMLSWTLQCIAMVKEAIKGGRTTSDHSSSNSNSNFINATTYNTTTLPPPPSSPWQPKQSPTLTQPSLLKQPTKLPFPPHTHKKEKKKRIHCHHPQNDHHQNYQKKIATTAQHPSRLFSLKFQVWFHHRSGTLDTAWQRTDQRVGKVQKVFAALLFS